jgi:hypothetical protein
LIKLVVPEARIERSVTRLTAQRSSIELHRPTFESCYQQLPQKTPPESGVFLLVSRESVTRNDSMLTFDDIHRKTQ